MRTAIFSFCFLFVFSCKQDAARLTFLQKDQAMGETVPVGSSVDYVNADSFSRNEIIVFESPVDKSLKCLRVLGFPGDTVEIVKGVIFLNGKVYAKDSSSRSIYAVRLKNSEGFEVLKRYESKTYSDNYAMIYINQKQLTEVKHRSEVDSIYELGFDSSYVYPDIIKGNSFRWFNHYYFGPIILPKVGEEISLSDMKKVSRFDISSVSEQIEEGFYFGIGDNFSDAKDSRIIGLIPRSKIVGKVVGIRKSKVIEATNY